MTKRHKRMIADRLDLIDRITKAYRRKPEEVGAVVQTYRFHDAPHNVSDVIFTCGYLPDSLLETLCEEVEKW